MKTKFNRSLPRVPQKKINDICEIYIKYRGRKEKEIVREMRARGWRKFSANILYRNGQRGCPGWIQRLRLRELLSLEDRHALEMETVQRGFKFWLRWASPEMEWNWKFQEHIYRKLLEIKRDDCKRLMLFLPPRHGKSELVTIRFTAWLLSLRPQTRVIIGSYNQKLANRFSRRVRRLYASRQAGNDTEEALQPNAFLNTAEEWGNFRRRRCESRGRRSGRNGVWR